MMNITIFRNPNDGLINYIRSSDGKVFPLPIKDDIVKINEVFDTLQNATDYEITSINTTDNVPTYQLCCKAKYPNVLGSQGKKGATGNMGPTGPAGQSGGTGQLFLNAIIVDAVYGDDTTAAQFTLMDSTNNPATHKFKTIDAAIASPNANTHTIVVYPGDYTVTNNLATGGTYYFYAGANVTCNINYPNGLFVLDATHTGVTNVYGYGNFSNTNNSNSSFVIAGIIGTGTLNINCANVTGVSFPVYSRDGNIILNVTGTIIATGHGSTVSFFDSLLSDNEVYIKAHVITSLRITDVNADGIISIEASGTGSSWKGNALIECDILQGSINDTTTLIYLGSGSNINQSQHIKININQVIIPNKTGNDSIILIGSYTYSHAEININIYEPDPTNTRTFIELRSTNTGSYIYINGNFFSINCTILDHGFTSIDSEVHISGRYETVNATNTILIREHSTTYINGTIISGGSGIGINKTTSTASGTILVLENAKIITAGGLAISAPAGDTVKVIHSLAMNNVSSPVAASINSIVGSICYTDAGVI